MKKTDAVSYQDRLNRELEKKRQDIRAREFAALERQTTTVHTRIPDMRDAYAQVRTHGDDYPEEYKDFIRRTSGRIV